jgi:uncharacterized protein YfiM (DUF2279 family)
MLRVIAIAALLVGGLAALLLQGAPAVPQRAPPDSATTVTARAAAKRLLEVRRSDDPAPAFALTAGEITALAAVAARVLPGLRIDATAGAEGLALRAAQPVPGGLWLNGEAVVVSTAEGLRLGALRLGRLPLPPGAALGAGLWLADFVTGRPGLGALAAALRDVRIDAAGASATLAMPRAVRADVSDRLQGTARRVAGTVDGEMILAVLREIGRAQQEGRLPSAGSALPHLRYAIEAAIARAAGPAAAQREAPVVAGAALVALAIACGDRSLHLLAGGNAAAEAVAPAEGCRGTTLGGRMDLRRHFTVSAALKAASEMGAAAVIGELKELYDSRPRGSGFSFDDIAANRAGVAFASRLMASPPEAWPALLAALDGEAAVMPAFADLPSGMSARAFEARFRDVESPAFAAMIAEIDRRIAALPWHRLPLAEAGSRPGRG